MMLCTSFQTIICLCIISFSFVHYSFAIDVEKEIHEIRTLLQSIQEENLSLKNENRLLRQDIQKLYGLISIGQTKRKPDELPDGEHIQTNKTVKDSIVENNLDLGNRQMPKVEPMLQASHTNGNFIRSMPASEPQVVAFYAYMSSNTPAPSVHYQLVFDIAKTNIGGGYNHYTGTFNAPIQGVYVFAWTIYTASRGQTWLDVLVNNDVYSSTLGETDDVLDYDSDSGTIVVSLNQGDSVYIRSSHQATASIISNNAYRAKTSFAGWKLN